MQIGDARSSWEKSASGQESGSLPLSFLPQTPGQAGEDAPPTCQTEGYCSYCGRCAELK